MELTPNDSVAEPIQFRKLESDIPSCCRLRIDVPDFRPDAYLNGLPEKYVNQHKGDVQRKKWNFTDPNGGDTELLRQWTEVAEFLRDFPGEIDKAHISILEPGNVLRVHRDGLDVDGGPRPLYEMFNRSLRFHIALRTAPECYIYADGELVHMKPGECWMINNMKYHSAVNGDSTQNRVHLIFDVRPNEKTFRLIRDAQQGLGTRSVRLFKRYWPDSEML